MNTSVTLVLKGAVPSKKNMYRRATVRGKPTLVLDKKATALIGPLTLQARTEWNRRGGQPLVHPKMSIRFSCSTDALDRDGMVASLLDSLQDAGLLANDNIRHFNERLVIEPALLCAPGQEQVEITIEPSSAC